MYIFHDINVVVSLSDSLYPLDENMRCFAMPGQLTAKSEPNFHCWMGLLLQGSLNLGRLAVEQVQWKRPCFAMQGPLEHAQMLQVMFFGMDSIPLKLLTWPWQESSFLKDSLSFLECRKHQYCSYNIFIVAFSSWKEGYQGTYEELPWL